MLYSVVDSLLSVAKVNYLYKIVNSGINAPYAGMLISYIGNTSATTNVTQIDTIVATYNDQYTN